MASADPLARRRSLTLNDFIGHTVAVDPLSGTTTPTSGRRTPDPQRPGRWAESKTGPPSLPPVGPSVFRPATARQHLRPGVVYRPMRDAQPIAVWLAWWRDSPPRLAKTLVQLICDLYGAPTD